MPQPYLWLCEAHGFEHLLHPVVVEAFEELDGPLATHVDLAKEDLLKFARFDLAQARRIEIVDCETTPIDSAGITSVAAAPVTGAYGGIRSEWTLLAERLRRRRAGEPDLSTQQLG